MNLIENLLESEHKSETIQRIYTTDFHNREVTDLPNLLKSLEAILIDVRFIPKSTPMKWSKDYLKLLLKNKYLHVPSLGNRSSTEGKTAIQNLSLGIKIITELRVNVLLFCRCEREETCHLNKITDEFKSKGLEVKKIIN